MLFNSVEFLFIFLPIALGAFLLARRHSNDATLVVLFCLSLAFYSYWNWRNTPLIVGSVIVNYFFAKALETSRSKRLLWTAIAANLAPLVWFKYAHWLGSLVGLDLPLQELPLGVSFVTFLQIAFVVDVWSGRVANVRALPYSVFVTYFPHLISGPILRYREISPQLGRLTERDPDRDERIARALLLIIVGLFSKVAIADTLTTYIDPLHARAQSLTFWDAWTAALGYSVVLLADFSGFCSVALGVSLLFGVTIPINFWSPYRATSITDFWRRWHITLGMWFRDYVYIPLGGNRKGWSREMAALVVTFFLAGLWHGAANTFVVWGLLHAAMIIVHRAWQRFGRPLPDGAGQVLTLLGVVIAWVPFRSSSMSDAIGIWSSMLGLNGFTLPDSLSVFRDYLPSFVTFVPVATLSGVELFVILAILGGMATLPNVNEWKLQPQPRWAAAMGCMALVIAFSLSRPSPYLYWQW